MSRRQLAIFKVGCYFAFLTAALHMVGHFMMAPNSDADRALFEHMQSVPLGLPGAPSHTMMDLYKGFSMVYSLMLALTGGLGLIVARRGVQDPTLMLAVARALAGGYFVMTVIGFSNFFIIPTVLMAAMFVCFALASVRIRRQAATRGHAEGIGLLVAIVGVTLAAAPQRQREPHKMMGDELYAAYLGSGPSILATAFPNGTRGPEFDKDFRENVLPRWEKQPRDPMRAMFMMDVALARVFLRPGFMQLGSAYLTGRPEPIGANPELDAFELEWHKTVFAYHARLKSPPLLERALMPVIEASRIVPSQSSSAGPALVDPWITLATGFVHEVHAFFVAESDRADDAIAAYRSAAAHEATRPEAAVRLARMYLFVGKPAEALQVLETFRDEWTRDDVVRYWARVLRGKTLAALDRPEDAVKAYERALQLRPEAPSPRLGIMAIDSKRDRAESAEAIASGIRRSASETTDPWWQLALGDARLYAERDRRLRELASQ
jgi:hypothetical protein